MCTFGNVVDQEDHGTGEDVRKRTNLALRVPRPGNETSCMAEIAGPLPFKIIVLCRLTGASIVIEK